MKLIPLRTPVSILAAVLCAGAIALLGTGCGAGTSPAQQPARRSDAVPVVVATVATRDVPLEVQVIGNVEAYSTVAMRSQVTGLLLRAHFQEGDSVKRGDLLFTIDPSPFQAQVAGAEADLARNEALLGQAEASLKRDIVQQKYAQAQAARYTQLFHDGVLSKDQTEQQQASADAMAESVRADEASIRSARAGVVAARATLANLKIQLGYTTIRSPIDGRTGNLAVNAGNLVTANSMDLITINQVQPIYVTFPVPESNLPAIKQYMARGKLEVMAAAQNAPPGEEETGVLTFVDNTVDPATGTIKLKGTFSNQNRRLWPGEFVRVRLRLATQGNALVVPDQAVQTGQEGSFVYVVKPDQTVESRPVVTGSRVDQVIVVQSGLQAGETVVTEGQLRLAPGMKVRTGAGRQGPPAGARRAPGS
jgi:membrane fusion protein, multidrug efflux system